MIRMEPQEQILHDIRNALSSIRMTAESLGSDKDALTRHRAERMLRTVDECTEICETRLRSFASVGVRAEANAVAIAAEIVHDLAGQEGQTLRILLECPDAGALPVRCDPQALRRILRNLLQNAGAALAAQPEPVVRLRLRAEGAFVVIEVSSNAGGLSNGGEGYGGTAGLRDSSDGSVHGPGARSTDMFACMYGDRMMVAETGPDGMRLRVILPAAPSRCGSADHMNAGRG